MKIRVYWEYPDFATHLGEQNYEDIELPDDYTEEEIEKETYELNQKMNMTSQTQVSVIQKVKNLIETIKDKLNHWRDMSDTLIKELIYKIVVYSKEKLDIYINVASYQKISYENGVFVLPNVSEME